MLNPFLKRANCDEGIAVLGQFGATIITSAIQKMLL